ncbi:phosphatase PAP2 family protein [Cupriavidus respiraculi]|nr:phosphatase PAP2 family protein [Cupriavidus respiraculi]
MSLLTQWAGPTPAVALAALVLLLLLSMLALLLMRAVLAVLRPVVRGLDGLRLSARDALGRRRGEGSYLVRVLERDAAELLLLAAAAAALFACGGALIWLEHQIAAGAPLVRLDHAVFDALQRLRAPWLDIAMVALTEFGGFRIALAVGVAVFAWLAWRRQWAAAAYWAGALLGARVCVVVLKYAVERSRPASIYGGIESFSFPSGHATSSMVTYGFLAFLLCIGQRWRVRVPVVAVLGVLVVLIGLSRLYLGMHWLSDVLAGYALALAWIVLLGTAYLTLHGPRRLPAGQLAAVAAGAALLVAAWLFAFRLDGIVERYRNAVIGGTPHRVLALSPRLPVPAHGG